MSLASDADAAPACPVCAARASFVLETRDEVPLLQNLVYPTPADAQACRKGALEMRRCRACGFVWNARFDASLSIYEEGYDNAQTYSDVFVRHLEAVAERVVGGSPSARPNLLEIGCGQGDFLQRLTQRWGGRLGQVAGFDPAWRRDAAPPSGAAIHAEYFTPEAVARLGFHPDVVVSRHTIEHVPDPVAFMASIRAACQPGARLFIETPTADWILENGVVFDFFYEHCSLFNPNSLGRLIETSGLEVLEITPVFDGQYLLAMAQAPQAGEAAETAVRADGDYDDLGYGARRADFLARIRALIRAAPLGQVALWGGASKGVTLTLLLGEDRDRLACAIDINTRKQGAFMPMSGLPIVSPERAVELGVTAALAVNPAYVAEIRAYCAERGLPLTVAGVEL